MISIVFLISAIALLNETVNVVLSHGSHSGFAINASHLALSAKMKLTLLGPLRFEAVKTALLHKRYTAYRKSDVSYTFSLIIHPFPKLKVFLQFLLRLVVLDHFEIVSIGYYRPGGRDSRIFSV